MKSMLTKTIKLGMLVLMAVACLVSATVPLMAQEDVIVLTPQAPKGGQRPAVSFPHARHADLLDCLRCHHDFDKLGNNTGSEGQACADCHNASGQDKPITLTRAYHAQCKGCHTALNASERKKLPVMCGQCHIR